MESKGLGDTIEKITTAIMLYPADDHENFDLIYKMYKKFEEGFDIVCASRFVEGGSYEGAPFIKRLIGLPGEKIQLLNYT